MLIMKVLYLAALKSLAWDKLRAVPVLFSMSVDFAYRRMIVPINALQSICL